MPIVLNSRAVAHMAAMAVLILAALAAGTAGALAYGASRWRGRIRKFRARMAAARLLIAGTAYNPEEIAYLPPPVRRYFGAVLQAGQPIVTGMRLTQEGRFRRDGDEWRPFTATQVVTTRPPGFDWDARMSMAPGVTAYVQDAYAAGEGRLHAEALALITVADARGTPESAQGELLRYLAEAVWYPTALLPSQGVRWEAVDDSAARATLTDGATTVSLAFGFDSEGLITSCNAAARCREVVDGVPEFAPWLGRFWAYEIRDGMRIPMEGEVAWEMPAGPVPYFRARLGKISYEFARQSDLRSRWSHADN